MCQISTDTFILKTTTATATLSRKNFSTEDDLSLRSTLHQQVTTFKPYTNTGIFTWCSYVLLSVLTLGDPVSTQNLITCITVSSQSLYYYPQAWFTTSYAPTAWT